MNSSSARVECPIVSMMGEDSAVGVRLSSAPEVLPLVFVALILDVFADRADAPLLRLVDPH